ncbi:hypothetical protein B0H13DRAFT_1879759 [Mycena leptocephala]|nr:hypothetical protein B0H13DRAFT_1879759 [Mycena leptocephala]
MNLQRKLPIGLEPVAVGRSTAKLAGSRNMQVVSQNPYCGHSGDLPDGRAVVLNDSFSNELNAFERTIFDTAPPPDDYLDLNQYLPNFDPLAFDFNTDYTISFLILPTPESFSPRLPILPMPPLSPPPSVTTPDEGAPAVPSRKRSRPVSYPASVTGLGRQNSVGRG